MSPPNSPRIAKAASEPRLSLPPPHQPQQSNAQPTSPLPHSQSQSRPPLPSPIALPPLMPPAGHLRPMLPDDTMYPVTVASPRATPSPSPPRSPPAPAFLALPSSSSSSQQQQQQQPNSAISFTEYVASEFANDDSAHFALAFARAPATSPTPAVSAAVGPPRPPAPPRSPPADPDAVGVRFAPAVAFDLPLVAPTLSAPSPPPPAAGAQQQQQQPSAAATAVLDFPPTPPSLRDAAPTIELPPLALPRSETLPNLASLAHTAHDDASDSDVRANTFVLAGADGGGGGGGGGDSEDEGGSSAPTAAARRRDETAADALVRAQGSPLPLPSPPPPPLGGLPLAAAGSGTGADGGELPREQTARARASARSRHAKLDCVQLDSDGHVSERSLTRAEIVLEARAPMSFPPVDDTPPWADPVTAAHGDFPPSGDARRATQRSLRDYLRNSLQARDIRQVDPAFAAKPALWVRHTALVVSLEGLRAIILHDKMFVFDTGRAETRSLLFVAKRCVLANPDAENPQPFEFKALEGILIFLAMGLEREFSDMKPEIEMYLHQLPTQLTTKMLEELRRRKQQLNHFRARLGGVKTILENLLEDDEEMANMYLSEKHAERNVVRDSQDHSEIETLLEAYLQVIDEHVNHSSLLHDAIDDTEDLVMIHLDTLRNRLLSVELLLSVVGLTFAFGATVSGVFGMNLQMPLFETGTSYLWFFGVVIVIVVMVIGVSWRAIIELKRRGLYSLY